MILSHADAARVLSIASIITVTKGRPHGLAMDLAMDSTADHRG